MGDVEMPLTFTVKVTVYGDPDRLRGEIGKRIAKICNLNFRDVEVADMNGNRYDWSPALHDGGLK